MVINKNGCGPKKLQKTHVYPQTMLKYTINEEHTFEFAVYLY